MVIYPQIGDFLQYIKMNKYLNSLDDEPKLSDFGITAGEYTKFKLGYNRWNAPIQIIDFLIAVISGLIIGFTNKNPFNGIVLGFAIWLGLAVCSVVISDLVKQHSPLFRKVHIYNEALINYYHTKEKYWLSLKDIELEHSVGDLYK